jgi:hypothetical protein
VEEALCAKNRRAARSGSLRLALGRIRLECQVARVAVVGEHHMIGEYDNGLVMSVMGMRCGPVNAGGAELLRRGARTC